MLGVYITLIRIFVVKELDVDISESELMFYLQIISERISYITSRLSLSKNIACTRSRT